MSAAGWPVILVLCSILGLHNASRIGPVPLLDELRLRYEVDYAGVGNIVGAYTISYAFAQLTAGFLTDRYGSRRLLLFGLAVAAAGSGLFALASSYSLAIAGRLLMGLAGGFLYTPTIAYTFAAFERRQRGRAMGFAETGVGAGQVLGMTLLPVLFLQAGLVGAYLAYPVAALALWLSVYLGLPSIRQERRTGGGQLVALARDRDFWLMLLGFAFVGMLAQVALAAWLPTYLRLEHGYDVVEAGVGGAIVVAGLMVFSPIFGVLSDRVTARRSIMLLGCVLGLAGWLALLGAPSAWVAIAGAVLVSASMAATIPTQMVFASERFAAIGAGTAVGLINTGSQIAASLGGPLYGAMLDYGLGFGTIWSTTAALGALRIVVVLLLRERKEGGAGSH